MLAFFDESESITLGSSFTHVILSAAKDLDPSVVPPSGWHCPWVAFIASKKTRSVVYAFLIKKIPILICFSYALTPPTLLERVH